MTFTDLSFFFFLALCLLAFRLTPLRSRWITLIVAGALYYSFLDVRFLVALLIMAAMTYAGCLALSRVSTGRRALVWTTVGFIVTWLVLIKWNRTNAIQWLGPQMSLYPGEASSLLIGLAFPIGISFHALQCVSVLVDTYRKPRSFDPHPGKMLLYLTYLPQILAGPIEKAQQMYPQFEAPKLKSADDAFEGLELFLLGLFKKTVLADRFMAALSVYARTPEQFQNSYVAAFFIFGFPLGLYFDFSGFIDIARGMSLWFGIRLSRNFIAPFKSATTEEAWRRWHATFNTFFRDYVFFPLARTRVPIWLAGLVTFALSGLWHGLALNFLIWSLIAYAIVIAEILISRRFPGYRKIPMPGIRSSLLVAVGTLFFFAPDLATVPSIVGGLAGPLDFHEALEMFSVMGLKGHDFAIYGIFASTILYFDGRDLGPRRDFARWSLLVFAVFAILVLRFSSGTLHSYFKF